MMKKNFSPSECMATSKNATNIEQTSAQIYHTFVARPVSWLPAKHRVQCCKPLLVSNSTTRTLLTTCCHLNISTCCWNVTQVCPLVVKLLAARCGIVGVSSIGDVPNISLTCWQNVWVVESDTNNPMTITTSWYPADFPDVEFALEFIDYFIIESIATLRHSAPAKCTRVINTHQKYRHLATWR